MPSAFRNLAFLAFLIFVFSCSSPKGYIPYEGLNGKPHHVQLIDFEAITDGSLTEPQVSSWEIYEFDEKGRKVGYQVYRNDASRVNGGIKYFYSNKGPIQYQEHYELNGELRSRTDFTYDQKGRLIKYQTIAGGKETSSKEITYDPEQPISYTKIIYNGKAIMQNSTNQLDKKGRMLMMTDYGQNGAFKGRIGYAYDKNGNEVLQKWYNSKDELIVFYKKYFNDRNEQILNEKYEIIQGDTVLTSTTSTEYEYDDLGNQSQVTNKTGGSSYIKKVVVYYPETK